MDTGQLFEKFIDSYSSLPSDIKEIIDKNLIGEMVSRHLVPTTGIAQRNQIINQLHFCLVNLVSIDDIRPIVQSIISDPKVIDSLLHEFSNLNKSVLTVSEKVSIDSDIAETEAALAQVDAVRTMQRDMQAAGGGGLTDEPVYTSSQSALLRESARTANPGTAPVLNPTTTILTPSPVPNAAPSTTTAPNIPIRPVTIAAHTNANTPVPIPPRADTAQIQTPRTAIPATAAPDMPRWETETEA